MGMMILDYKKTDDDCLVLEIKDDSGRFKLLFEKGNQLSFWTYLNKNNSIETMQAIPVEFIELLREQLKEA